MNILGINAYHGSASACLIRGGELVAAIEEERLNRQPGWEGFPVLAIRSCLETGGLTPFDLHYVGIASQPRANLHRQFLHVLSHPRHLAGMRDQLRHMAPVGHLETTFANALRLNPKYLRAQFFHIEHHRAHMASTFFVSPFEEAAILSLDSMGDFTSAMWGVGHGHRIYVNGALYFPHSLGYVYTLVTHWLGFPNYGGEDCVMHLAGAGQPVVLEQLRRIVRMQPDGAFALNLDYLDLVAGGRTTWRNGTPVRGTLFSDRFVKEFGPPRHPGGEITPYHKDVAASLQALLEEAEVALLRRLHRQTGLTTLCLAGGVALNSVCNGKIRLQTPFQAIFIQPAAGAAGTALGAAYDIYHRVLDQPRKFVMTNAFTGPSFSTAQIDQSLRAYGLSGTAYSEDELCREAARRIAAGQIVGWFQGRMEWGPHALGHRSLLADPRRHESKDKLNLRIRRREPFRPLACSILLERTGEFFEQDHADPFMLMTYAIHPHQRARVPAVTHVDGTGCVQTVERASAPLYWQVIHEFDNLTGVPLVINTSFNEHEPMLCTAEQAIDCFVRTGMDALALGNMIVTKCEQPTRAVRQP